MQRQIARAVLVLIFAGIASATVTTSTFTASGSSGGDGQAVFTFNNMTDILTVTLTNLLPNPSSSAQNITGLDFQIQSNEGTLACNSNCLAFAIPLMGTVTINSGGSYAVNPNYVNPGWAVTHGTGGFVMNGTSAYAIVGAPGNGGYTNANSTLVHNPMINQSAEWMFLLAGLPNVAGLTVTPTHVVFSFGPSGTNLFSCDSSANACFGAAPVIGTPEPWSFLLAGTGLIGIYFIRRRKSGSR
jgi:hypothetical protein